MNRERARSERQTFWLGHLRACADGSMTAYAAANALNVRSLYGAKKRLKRQGLLGTPAPRLVRVERTRACPTSPALCRVQLRNGVAVEVPCTPAHWGELFSRVAALP